MWRMHGKLFEMCNFLGKKIRDEKEKCDFLFEIGRHDLVLAIFLL